MKPHRLITDKPDRWPAFVHPQADELLSSWLLRTAHAHTTKAHTFCRVVWPTLSVWNRDVDRMAPPAVWQLMAAKSGESAERGYQTTLAAYQGTLFTHHTPNGNSRWIMPLGIYHRERTRYGTMFCPTCLKKDQDRPYYRRMWRLSLSVVCADCGCFLHDQCPQCARPIAFHRNEIGRKNELSPFAINRCAYCRKDLTAVASCEAPRVLLAYQRSFLDSLSSSPTQTAYFDVLHHLIMQLNSGRPRLAPLRELVARQTAQPYWVPEGGYEHGFERLRLHDRSRLLLMAGWLLTDWPDRLVETCSQSRVWTSFLLQDAAQQLPDWFTQVVYKRLAYLG